MKITQWSICSLCVVLPPITPFVFSPPSLSKLPPRGQFWVTYICFGSTCTRKTEDLQNHWCMPCRTVSSNKNQKPSQLQQHFNSKCYGGCIFGFMIWVMKSSWTKIVHFESWTILTKLSFVSTKQTLMASYKVVFKVAKSKKSHTIPKQCLLHEY